MPVIVRIIIALALIPVLGFCIFGFLATFEPLDAATQLRWRLAYGVAGMLCLAGLVLLALPRRYGRSGSRSAD